MTKSMTFREAQSCCEVESVERVPFVLEVECRCVVGGFASFYSQGCFQPVVSPLDSCAEPLVVGQLEHAFEVCHGSPLVALQLLL